jgi:hypothetical protein
MKRFASLGALRGCAVAAMLPVNDPGDRDHVFAWVMDRRRIHLKL